MSLNIKKVQLGYRNEQLENKSPEGLEYYFRDDSNFGGIVVDTIDSRTYSEKSMENRLELIKIEQGKSPYKDGLKLPICMNIPMINVRLDKDLNIIACSKMATTSVENLVEDLHKPEDSYFDLRSEDYKLYISMDIGTRISTRLPHIIGKYVTFENLYEYEIGPDGKEDKCASKIKDTVANICGSMYIRVLHTTKKLCNEVFNTETDEVDITELFYRRRELNRELGSLIEEKFRDIDTLYVSEDLIREQFLAETDLLALDVIKLVKKGTDRIDNPTGEFLGVSVEALIETDSAKYKLYENGRVDYLSYLVKGKSSSLHSINGIDSIKCVCVVTNIVKDSVDEDYLSILIPKGRLLDMKTKYIEDLNVDDEDPLFMGYEPFNREDIDNFFDNSSDKEYKPTFDGLGGDIKPFSGAESFGGGLYSMRGYNPGIGGFGSMAGFKPLHGFGGFGYPYEYDLKTLKKMNKLMNKARKNKF